ncbi:hypothetical protein HJG60_007827 [Phyllostomus discolor]|uniref:Uncharacterized protein n=1 Tax=Phyllostomus discolor TaxID=89673 RepID=A0A834BHH7_9CHIR|nr:hypothetical protein HJG60_007827 [Phyllostomus discolor]
MCSCHLLYIDSGNDCRMWCALTPAQRLVEQTFLDFLETSPALLLPNGGPRPITQPSWAMVSSCVRGVLGVLLSCRRLRGHLASAHWTTKMTMNCIPSVIKDLGYKDLSPDGTPCGTQSSALPAIAKDR